MPQADAKEGTPEASAEFWFIGTIEYKIGKLPISTPRRATSSTCRGRPGTARITAAQFSTRLAMNGYPTCNNFQLNEELRCFGHVVNRATASTFQMVAQPRE
jgi:hypothetical protein